MARLIRDRTELILDRFSHYLGFDFAATPTEDCPRRTTGLAPEGRVGVLDVVDGSTIEVSFLFSRTPQDFGERDWVDHCLIALSDAVDVDFLDWFRCVTTHRGSTTSWAAHRRFDNGEVAIRFDPFDILVLTVHQAKPAVAG